MELLYQGFCISIWLLRTLKYGKWLKDAGFSIKRLELNSKDMALEGEKGLFAGLLRPGILIIQQVYQELREDFINEFVALFVRNYPLDNKGYAHIQIKRLEIEAYPEK